MHCLVIVYGAKRWVVAGSLAMACGIAIVVLIADLIGAPAADPTDFTVPSQDATSMAISWIALAALVLTCIIRPWSYGLHNYGSRIGACLLAWIVSEILLISVGMAAPAEMRVLGLWHLAILGILVTMLIEGMLAVALSGRQVLTQARVVQAPIGARDTTLYAVARRRPGLR